MRKLTRLALKLLFRDWRSGELTILAAALFIAVTAMTTVTLLGDRLNRTMTLQAAAFLGADLSVSGHLPPPAEWSAEAVRLGLQAVETVEFSSVLVENEELLLVGVKAVPAGYPLRGALTTRAQPDSPAAETHEIPAPGEAWIEPQVLTALKLTLGSTVTVGEKALRLTRLIADEPDRRGDLYSLSPRIIINRADLAATGVIQPGSHVHHYALFSGQPAALQQLKNWLKPRLQTGQRIADLNEDRPELGKAIVRAERYLGLASIAVALIAGVAIAMSARRYTERHFDLMAILKCLGASEREVLALAGLQFLFTGIFVTTLGSLAGWGLQAGIIHLAGTLLPHTLAPPGWTAWLLGGSAGLLLLFGFALPPILRLKRLPPLRVLRRDLEPLPSSALMVYGLAALTVTLLLWRHTGEWQITLTVLGVSGLLIAAFAMVGLSLLKLGRWLMPYAPLAVRLGLQHLTRRPRHGVTQILAFSLTLAAMLIITLVRTELIQQWRQQIPVDAPNHFALNLFDADLPAFRAFLEREALHGSAIYPIVRGRLVTVNGQAVSERIGQDARAEGAINRELSLTWATTLPPDNRVIAGQWPDPGPGAGVSMEQDLAVRLGVNIGDRLAFTIAGQPLEARVSSLRSVRWDNMTPNFYMIFSPGVLDGYPHSWLTSFHAAPAQTAALTRLMKAFPGLTLLDIGKLIGQFQAILQQLSLAIEFILALALAAGFTVLFATIRATLDERLHEDTLLRVMGASNRLLRGAQWVEFAALGFMSGMLSALITEAIAWLVYRKMLDLAWRPHGWVWVATPLLGALAVGGAGYWNARGVLRISPMRVLREL